MMYELKMLTLRSTDRFVKSMLIFCIAAFPLKVACTQKADDVKKVDPSKDFYQFNVIDMNGVPVSLNRYRHKVSLVVNVASECGYTDQHYKDLVKLQKELYLTDHFNVLAFPCNQFGKQEPGTNDQILQFVSRKYNINFRIFSKINVTGEDVPDAWKLLEAESGEVPTWNFYKYLVNGKGHVVKVWGPWVDIADIKDDINKAIEELIPHDYTQKPHHDHEEL